ncbi:hypothetical protein JCM8097_001561 [Rhodosporidiobolus ruineniae]
MSCQHCYEGGLLNGEAKGTVKRFETMDFYVAEGSGNDKTKAIVLGVDIFGLVINNPRIIADILAKETGLSVYAPDYFEGDYPDTALLKPAQEGEPTAPAPPPPFSFDRDRFRAAHPPERCQELSIKFINFLKAEHGYQRIGWVGYCWGGGLAIRLATADSPVDVAICAHPGGITSEHFKAVSKPVALICAETDQLFDEHKAAAIAILEEKKQATGLPYVVNDHYPATVHGFAARPNLANPTTKASFETSLKDTVVFFKEYL